MAIVKLRNGKVQVKVKGPDGKWITQCFTSRRDARRFEADTRERLRTNRLVCSSDRQITVDNYFCEWFASREHQASPGWRREQKYHYERYVRPFIGYVRLHQVTPALITRVLVSMANEGKAAQTRLHTFNLLRKMFGDAIELFQLITFNPVLLTLKPKVPVKESRHLSVQEATELAKYVVNRPYGVAIWVQLFLGLRVGELQALRWEDLDLKEGWMRIYRTYVRKDKIFKDYPKGRKQHTKKLPPELIDFLKKKWEKSNSEFVATRMGGGMLVYEWYNRTLIRYCRELEITQIGTHGLRHTTSELYLSHGATRDDLRCLFAHSSAKVTDRYVHEQGTRLEKVTSSISLLGEEGEN